MLTLITLVAEGVETSGSKLPVWLFHPPNIFTVVDIIITLVIGVFLIVYSRKYTKHKWDEINSADYHRFAQRMLNLEREQHAVRERLESMASDAASRHEERIEALHTLVDTSVKQHEEGLKQAGNIDKLLKQSHWIAKTLQERPCVMNESNGDEDCPDGHDIKVKEKGER